MYTQTSTLLNLLWKKNLISLTTISAWSILSEGGEDHVALQSTLTKGGADHDAARKYVNELLKFGFLTPTTDPRFTKNVRGGKPRRAFDLNGTPDLSQWLTEDEIQGQRKRSREEKEWDDQYREFMSDPPFVELEEDQRIQVVNSYLEGDTDEGR